VSSSHQTYSDPQNLVFTKRLPLYNLHLCPSQIPLQERLHQQAAHNGTYGRLRSSPCCAVGGLLRSYTGRRRGFVYFVEVRNLQVLEGFFRLVVGYRRCNDGEVREGRVRRIPLWDTPSYPIYPSPNPPQPHPWKRFSQAATSAVGQPECRGVAIPSHRDTSRRPPRLRPKAG